MRAKNKLFTTLLTAVLLLIPLAHGAGLSITAPDSAVEGSSVEITFSVFAETPFDGEISISYNNINSTSTKESFTKTDFAGKYHNKTISAKANRAGSYKINANLTNSTGKKLDADTKTGTVNSSAPRITKKGPSGIISDNSATLRVETNEKAACKYDASDKSYANMSGTFENTESKKHNQSLEGLSQGKKTYYVRCRDDERYVMNESETIKFEVDLPPTASISLSDSSPVKEGTIEVTVITSENLEEAPTLGYSFNDNPNIRHKISLTGSNSRWEGFLIITEEDDNKIGTFHFSAKDEAGNTGTKITKGKLFVVDTKPPESPTSIKTETLPGGSIRLKWHYTGEETSHFNIYRATSSGISYVDFYAEANDTDTFMDSSTVDKVTYYYKVAAVDRAGNEGDLSNEVFATSVNKLKKTTTETEEKDEQEEESTNEAPKVLPPDLVPSVNTELKKVDKMFLDVKDVSNALKAAEGDKKELITDLQLLERVEQSNTELEGVRNRLERIKEKYHSKEELENKLKDIDAELKKIRRNTPRDAEVSEKTRFVQTTSEKDVEAAVRQLFENLELTEKEKENYMEMNTERKDDFEITLSAKVATIEYLDNTREEKTFINKEIRHVEPKNLSDIIVIETIPKSVAETANDVSFLTKKHEVLKEDPVVKFGFLEFREEGERISYTVDKRVDVEKLKESKSVVLLSLSELVREKSKATGLSIISLDSLGLGKTQKTIIWMGVLTILVLLTYYFLFVKEHGKKLVGFYHIAKQGSVRNEASSNAGYNVYYNTYPATGENAYERIPDYGNNYAAPQQNYQPFGQSYGSTAYPEHTYLSELIRRAHEYIDNEQHHMAKRLYPEINLVYKKLPKRLKHRFIGECVNLHSRMHNKW